MIKRIYKRLDYSGVNSCDSAVGEILGYLDTLDKDEAIEIVLDADWKLKDLQDFISKTKYKILDVKKDEGKYIVTVGEE